MQPFEHWQEAIQPRDTTPEELPSHPEGKLPPVFQFSQQSLQDYVDCPRRFQLRYILGQRWPAAESEPIEEQERLFEQGARFHLLVQRHILGIPEDKLAPQESPLAEWWDAYLRFPPPDLPTGLRLPEILLSTPLGDQRLLAKFDLLALDPGQRALIIDWKTSHHRPTRQMLASRMQSRVYPYVLLEAGTHLFGGPIDAEQIGLVYWFAETPTKPEVFPYTAAQHQDNHAYLSSLISEVLSREEATWPLTDHRQHCRYCIYRSLCDRGVLPGPFADQGLETAESDFDFDFDLDEVEEIAF